MRLKDFQTETLKALEDFLKLAELYGLNILEQDVEDLGGNTTRFLVIGKGYGKPTGNDKTSVVFSLKHRPGSLFEFLKEFSERKLNLTKIESRPTRQKPWEYNFYLDFEGHREDKIAREALETLEESALFLKVLGSYPKRK